MVAKYCACPRCKRTNTYKILPRNFRCADVVCDFCGHSAQVKTTDKSKNLDTPPQTLLGAAWEPQRVRLEAGIYISLYLVLKQGTSFAIYFLSADLQSLDMFITRKPLSKSAKRAGWQGFIYDLTRIPAGALICVYKYAPLAKTLVKDVPKTSQEALR